MMKNSQNRIALTLNAGAALIFAAWAASAPCGAQMAAHGAPTGTLDGKLTDYRSVPLAEAEVLVRNLATGETAHTTTGKNGDYRIASLGPGEYRLEAQVAAFGKGQVEGILISAGHTTRVRAALVMELPKAREPLEAERHDLDPVSPAVTTMIPTEELSQIPVRERTWQAIAASTPAANQASPPENTSSGLEDAFADAESSLSLGGKASSQTAQSVDGVPIVSGFRSVGKQPGASALGQSAVQSVEMRTGNGGVDGPRGTGGAMNLDSAHGRNGLHGQAFYLNRRNLWGAQNPLAQLITETAAATPILIAQFTPQPFTPPYSDQTFGLGAGGQIRRGKLYWFAALDGLYKSDPALATVRQPENFFLQPSDPELDVLGARLGQGNLQQSTACPGGTLPPAEIHEQEIACYSNWLQRLNGLLGQAPRTTSQIQGFARVDWQTTERDHLSVAANGAASNSPGGAIERSVATYGTQSFGNSKSSGAWAIARWERFLTANLLNVADFQLEHQVVSETAEKPTAFESAFIANTQNQVPEIVADSKFGFILGKPARLSGTKYPDETSLVLQDQVRWVRGQHLFSAGASFDHIADSTNSLANQTGTYSYADVLNFISDAASFTAYGFSGIGNPFTQPHNCDSTGRVHSVAGQVFGLGVLPCYAHFTQRIGPTNWRLSSNDLAAFVTDQWQPWPQFTLSASLRVEAEQFPPPIAANENPAIPATQHLPPATLNWGPRLGLAFSPASKTVLRLGAGLYFGRVDNAVILAALTQTGSANGDLNYFFKPTDPGAPPFPYVFPVQPQQTVAPGAVSFAPNFRPQQVDQAVFSLEQELPSHWLVSVTGMASLGRHLPISVDTNLAQNPHTALDTITYNVVNCRQQTPPVTCTATGPIQAAQITVPFYSVRSSPDYQQLDSIESRANSTYEAAMFKIVRYGGHGLSLRAHYLYAHATDWNPNESGNVAVNNPLDPSDFGLEYGTSNLDIRHSAAATVLYETPWKLRNWPGWLANAWSVAAVGQFRSGLPYTMRTSGYIPGFYSSTGSLYEGVAPGINGSGGDNRVYGLGSDKTSYDIGRNTFRYPATWTADTRIGKRFNLAHHRELELLAESFNLFNHQNVTALETTGYYIQRGSVSPGSGAVTLPTLNFMTGQKTNTVEFGKPLDINATTYYHPREIQLGLRARF